MPCVPAPREPGWSWDGEGAAAAGSPGARGFGELQRGFAGGAARIAHTLRCTTDFIAGVEAELHIGPRSLDTCIIASEEQLFFLFHSITMFISRVQHKLWSLKMS